MKPKNLVILCAVRGPGLTHAEAAARSGVSRQYWQPDIAHSRRTSDTAVEMPDFLDDHSRFLLDICTAAAFTAPMVLIAMTELMDRYGQPMSTFTDNGLVFTTSLPRFKGARGGFEKLPRGAASPRIHFQTRYDTTHPTDPRVDARGTRLHRPSKAHAHRPTPIRLAFPH